MLSGSPWQALSNICNDTHARAWVLLQVDLLRAPNTVVAYARGLDHYLGFCRSGSIDVASAGRAQITGYFRELVQPHSCAEGVISSATGLAHASIRHRLTVVRWFHDHLVEEGVRTTNPVAAACGRRCRRADAPARCAGQQTSTAFTKPVDAVIGQAVEVWEQQRLPHPSMLDAKTGSMVDYLFVHRSRRVGLAYLN